MFKWSSALFASRDSREKVAKEEEDLVGVALEVLDVVGIEPETVADDLLEHGLVALPLVDRTGEQGRRAAAVEPNLGAFEARRAGALDGVGDAEAAQLAALLGVRAACRKSVDVGEPQCH